MTPIEDDETRQSLIDFGSAEARAIWDYLSEMDVGGGTGVVNLGMAHGWAGILYAQLRWYLVAGGPLSTALEERVAALADLAEPVGRGACWPWIEGGAMHRGSQRAMPGWCNGSAGFVHLWTEAHRVFGDTRFLELARLASWDVWDHPSTVPHLCCGLGGRAYALLAMYRHTGDRDWLVRARALAERAFRARWPKEESLDHQSLYRGIVGLGLLAADLVRAERAAMPFFEAEGWPTAVMAAHV